MRLARHSQRGRACVKLDLLGALGVLRPMVALHRHAVLGDFNLSCLSTYRTLTGD